MLSKHIRTSRDLLYENFLLLAFRSLNTLLDDVVTISVFHHLVKCAVELLPEVVFVLTVKNFVNYFLL